MAWRADKLSKGEDATLDEVTVKSIITGKEYINELGETSFTTKNGYEITYKELYSSIPTTGGNVVVGEIVTGENAEYTTEDGTAKIPVGFAIVPGLDDISEGLVISDVANDTGNTGNQFVWIPVSKKNFATEFIRRAGYYYESLQDISSYGEADSTGANTDASITESVTTQAEAKAMYLSVATNGGFYIGRYEAGKDSDGNVVCQKGADVYNYIGWNNDTTNNDITVETGGAVELARNFASSKGYDTTQVHSTLCYSVQWDTALNFIDPGYTGYAKDSSKMGWYSDNYNMVIDGNTETNENHITGKDLIYSDNETVIANMHKNIYDMGGNIRELTMESGGTTKRVRRGGHYSYSGSELTASSRNVNTSSSNSKNDGFRLALYL